MTHSVCYECDRTRRERSPSCHTTCERYLAERKANLKQYSSVESDANSLEAKRRKRIGGYYKKR